MSLPALNEPSPVTAAPQSKKKASVSPRVRRACDLLETGECKTVTAAAERVGLSREHLSRALGEPHVQAFIAQRNRRSITVASLRAPARIRELMDASSEHVSLQASTHVLAIEGIRPPEAGTNISIINNVMPGYVIDLRDPVGPVVDVSPQYVTAGSEQDQGVKPDPALTEHQR